MVPSTSNGFLSTHLKRNIRTKMSAPEEKEKKQRRLENKAKKDAKWTGKKKDTIDDTV